MAGNPHPVPFAKTGAAANPNGRPKKEWTMAGLLRDALEELADDRKGGKAPIKQLVAKKLAALALAGDIVAIKEVNNRIDGMSLAKTEIGGQNGQPITYSIIAGNGYVPESIETDASPEDSTV